jgi:uncharacterized membrane protein
MKIKVRNKIIKIIDIAIICIFLLSFVFYQIVKAETELIKNFDVNITIQKDGSLLVTEKIVYDFGTNQRHGIFRNIPLKSANGPQLYIEVLEVKDEDGKSYQYTSSITNDILKIKIGDPNIFVTGSKTYIITYQVYNAIRTFEDHDELYWNVTGNEWPVVIQNTNVSVLLPDSSISNVKMDCFTGPLGSTQKNCIFIQSGSNVNYSITQPLNINEGLTIVLGIPLGYINKTYLSPSSQNSSTTSVLNSFSIFNILIILAFLSAFPPFIIITEIFLKRLIRRTKPKPVIPKELKKEPIIVEYDPPDNLTPIDIGTILDRRVDITDISSIIIDLAVKGYLKIHYIYQQIPFWPDKKDFEFVKIKDDTDLTHPAYKRIFKFLFDNRDRIKLSDFKKQEIDYQIKRIQKGTGKYLIGRTQKGTVKHLIERIQKDTEKHLYEKGYFDKAAKNKAKKIKKYLSSIPIILFFGYLVGLIFLDLFLDLPESFSPVLTNVFLVLFIVLALSLNGISLPILLYIMLFKNHRLTPKGLSVLKKILGFREFLQLTEKDRLELLNAPELQPEMFEKFLPYAMVLGVENKWAKKFEGIYNTIPNWYEDTTITNFNSYSLTKDLTSFNNSFNKVFNIPSTSSGFSSGFGGGGSSGGGSGGGGGGSW